MRPHTVSPTLSSLLSRADLMLRLESETSDLDEGALDRPLRWVHSSDLVDPTPFLSEGLVLLTTGTQFTAADAGERATGGGEDLFRAYVRRLGVRGVVGLGFGTEVVRSGVPPKLVQACRAERMPLFEVPYRTPFIAVARANAEAVAAESFARRNWALSAQRAISLAALRPDGLTATVAELGRQLETWVGMFDASGALTREHPVRGLPREVLDELRDDVLAVLHRGAQAGSSLRIGDAPFTLQTLGRGGHLRGVIAIASGDLDQEGRGVVTAVIAMAGLAFEQHQGLSRARARLRAALVQSLLADDPTLARRITHGMWGQLPAAPVTVAALSAPAAGLDVVGDALELRADERRGDVFFGRDGNDLVVVVPTGDENVLDELTRRFGVRGGLSDPAQYSGFSVALDQARVALESATAPLVRFADVARRGMLGALATNEARALARNAVAPLREYDLEHSTALLTTLRTWLRHDTSHDATASALGVHRHTVRARIGLAERVLDRHLSSFAARAELWAAMQALDEPGG